MAKRTGWRFSSQEVFSYFELSPHYAILEINPPNSWLDKSLSDLHIRSKHNLNVIAYKINEQVFPMTSASYVFKRGEHIYLAGAEKDLMKLHL
ncbi:MAG: TrkA C-terminal domain-containing protein, partial [Coriobacteriia bacterium]|nr:TrkA C-terminal domain-containing protein [Coriobacteriia bacterium]